MTRDEQKQAKKQKIEHKKREDYYANDYYLPSECDACCKFRPCFNKYENKGSYSTGKGYTSYNSDFLPACGTRLQCGCPSTRDSIGDEFDEIKALTFISDVMTTEAPDKKTAKREKYFSLRLVKDMILLKERQKGKVKEGNNND